MYFSLIVNSSIKIENHLLWNERFKMENCIMCYIMICSSMQQGCINNW